MQRTRLVLAGSIFLVLVMASCGCSSGSGNSVAPAVSSTPKTFNSLVFTVSTPHGSNRRSAVIPITFTIVNTGTQAANLMYGESCYDFAIQISQAGKQVTFGPSGEGCAGVLRPFTLAPGATQTYTFNWDQTNSAGNAVPTGIYTLVAQCLTDSFQGVPLDPASGQANFSSNPVSIYIGL